MSQSPHACTGCGVPCMAAHDSSAPRSEERSLGSHLALGDTSLSYLSTRQKVTLALVCLLLIAVSSVVGWFFPVGALAMVLGGVALILPARRFASSAPPAHTFPSPFASTSDSSSAPVPSALRRVRATVLAKPTVTAILLLVALALLQDLRLMGSYVSHYTTIARLDTVVAETTAVQETLRATLAVRERDVTAAKARAAAAKAELASYEAVIAPERTRREEAELEEEEAAKQREAKMLAEAKEASEERKADEERKAAALSANSLRVTRTAIQKQFEAAGYSFSSIPSLDGNDDTTWTGRSGLSFVEMRGTGDMLRQASFSGMITLEGSASLQTGIGMALLTTLFDDEIVDWVDTHMLEVWSSTGDEYRRERVIGNVRYIFQGNVMPGVDAVLLVFVAEVR